MSKARDLANAGTALGAVTATELAFVDGVTSAIQTQIDTKAPSSTAVTLTGTQTLTNKTLTNPVIASVVNNTLTSTTGDMIYASAANTPARLGIGSSAQVLTVSGGIPSWATASSGGMTLISTTTLSGASLNLTSIPQTYKSLYLVVRNARQATDNLGRVLRVNNVSTAIYNDVRSFSQANMTNSGGTYTYTSATNSDNGASDSLMTILINDYTNTTTRKILEIVNIQNNNTTLANLDFMLQYSVFGSNSAISELNYFPEAGNWTSGTALLYGVS
jgi:hypothetical protein